MGMNQCHHGNRLTHPDLVEAGRNLVDYHHRHHVVLIISFKGNVSYVLMTVPKRQNVHRHLKRKGPQVLVVVAVVIVPGLEDVVVF